MKWVCVPLVLVVALTGPCGIASAQGGDHAIRPGDRGADVVAVQQSLRSMGYTVAPDGQYGPQTERVVRLWQHVNGLRVDAIVGPLTLSTLHLPVATSGALRRPVGTPVPQPSGSPAPLSVEDIIRDVWPDDVEERALAIAYRESRFVPTAANACCFGLFQIHYAAHRAWLAAYGVTSPADLFDPTTNAVVALALYQQAGWGPWQT